MITTNNFTLFLRQCGWICVNPDTGPPVAPPVLPQTSAPPLKDQRSSAETVNYSEIIIRSLNKALEYFEEWNKPRLHNYILVLLANEHMNTRDLQKASALYTRSLALYEKENWKPLVGYIANKLNAIKNSIR